MRSRRFARSSRRSFWGSNGSDCVTERPGWDSNPRIADLQSAPLDRSGTRPGSRTLWQGRGTIKLLALPHLHLLHFACHTKPINVTSTFDLSGAATIRAWEKHHESRHNVAAQAARPGGGGECGGWIYLKRVQQRHSRSQLFCQDYSGCRHQHSNPGAPADHKNVLPLPDSGSIYPVNGYSYGNKTLSQTSGNNTATSVAAASVGAVTNSVNLGFTLASGTGLTQNDPSGNVFNGSAELKIEVKGTWDIGTGGYGGNSYGYIAFSLGSTVPAGGSAEVDVNLQWIDPDKMTLPNTYRANYNLSQAIGSGTKITPISNSAKLNSGAVIPSGFRVQVSGTITLLAHDPCGPVTITPSDFEFSATPPIWKFTAPPGGGTTDFGNASNWINVMGAANEPSPIPNRGRRTAQFIGSTVATGPVIVSQPATIGMLDLDQPGVNLQSVNGGALILDTPGSNAVIYVRSTNDTTTEGHTIAVPIALIKTTEMINDAAGAVMFTKPIGGPGGIEKSGAGEMVLASPNNTFLGNVDINGGALTVTGALPATGNVNVNAGGVLSGSGNGTTTGKVGSITLNGGSIRPGDAAADGHVGTLTATSLTVTSGDLRMDVGGPVGSDRINVTNVASIGGPLTITPVFSSISSIATGSYTLLSAGSLALSPGTTPILTGVPTTSRLNFALDSASVPNTILLNVTGTAPKTLNWKGTSSSNWDLNTSVNWQDTTLTNEHYFDYDTVTFDDTRTKSERRAERRRLANRDYRQ